MKVYIVYKEDREKDGRILVVTASRERAVQAIKNYLKGRGLTPEDIKKCDEDYDGNIETGYFYTEEYSITTSEKEVVE